MEETTMPCMDGGPSREQIERYKRFHVAMTRLACDRCRDLLRRYRPIPEWAEEWWAVHQADDHARREVERCEVRKKRARNEALAKLSPEDRDALGI